MWNTRCWRSNIDVPHKRVFWMVKQYYYWLVWIQKFLGACIRHTMISLSGLQLLSVLWDSDIYIFNLQDGRIWKERVSATVRRRSDISVMKEGESLGSDSGSDMKPPRPTQAGNRMILPSLSAPEHNILKLLEECNASGI